MSIRNGFLPILLLLAVGGGSARAQDALPASVQASFFLKVLSYDRALARNGGTDLVVAVMYDAASPASTAARVEFVRAVRAARPTVAGRPIRVVEINVAAGQVAAALKAQTAAAAYVTAGLDQRIPGIVEAARSSQVTTFGGSEAYARRGVAVTVDAPAGRPQLFVNLPAARSCGANLPSTLLTLATVIS